MNSEYYLAWHQFCANNALRKLEIDDACHRPKFLPHTRGKSVLFTRSHDLHPTSRTRSMGTKRRRGIPDSDVLTDADTSQVKPEPLDVVGSPLPAPTPLGLSLAPSNTKDESADYLEVGDLQRLTPPANLDIPTDSTEPEDNPFLSPQKPVLGGPRLAPPLVPDSLPTESQTQLTETATFSSPTKMLSYSQQQKDILIQSPSKRLTIKPRPVLHEPRLVIDKLVLTNFKLYAGVQEIGPFHASFSAVVGPNGLGKSNVIDLLLFVFGFRASKMRQLKLLELIHNSTEDKPDYCQVDIHFHNILDDPEVDGAYEVLPDSQIVISRRALRNNSSLYYIDGRNLLYSEVTAFLKDKGVDLDHKRFLILQGEVELIAQMKAKAEKENEDGLLEYLEDIIGTSKYKPLIEELLKRVEELNEACLEKEQRFELVEKDKAGLELSKEEALRFLEMEKRLAEKRLLRLQVLINVSQKVLTDNEQRQKDVESKLAQEREANSELLAQVSTHTEAIYALRALIEALAPELAALGKRQKELTKKKVTVEEKTKNTNLKLKKLQKQRETLEHQVNQASTRLAQLQQTTQEVQLDIESLNTQLDVEKAKLDDIRGKLRDKTQGFTSQIDQLTKELAPWNDQLSQKDNQLALARLELETLQSQKQLATELVTKTHARLAEIKVEGQSKELELVELEAKLVKISEQLELGSQQVAESKKALSDAQSEVSRLQTRFQEAKELAAHTSNKNKVLDLLTRLSRSGRVQGFYGRLGDLGQIDPAYDVAILTACPGLDLMVVATVETAQQCIEYLRKNKLGYATFVCLDKLRSFNMGPIQVPGGNDVKRLFDLVQPGDAKFAPAFYLKLRDCLVAPSLSVAKQVSYGGLRRFKVVTIDGKVVDTLGAMSGGGSYVAKGAMKLTTDAVAMDDLMLDEEIAQLQRNISDLQRRYDELRQSTSEKESVLTKLRELHDETEYQIQRLRLDIESLVLEKKEVKQRLRQLVAAQNERQEADAAIEAKQRRVEQLEADRNNHKLQMRGLELQIAALEQQVMDAGGVELKVQNSKVDLIKQQIEIIMERTSSDRKEVRKLENELQRHQELVSSANERIEQLTTEASTLETELTTLSEQQATFNQEMGELERTKTTLESELESSESQLEQQNEAITKFKLVELDLTQELDKIAAVVSKARRKIEADREQLDSVQLRETSQFLEWMDELERLRYAAGNVAELLLEELGAVDVAELEGDIERLENYFADVRCDIEVLLEYGAKIAEYEARRGELNTAVALRDEVKHQCENLRKTRLLEFMEGFNQILMTLKEMYRMITIGGNAELELVDLLDPFAEGILFLVMPPKKLWRNILNLSGGEKTLSSLALVFALHAYKPTPLYVMDEIDAALDFRNVSIVANYIKERTKNAQFVVISLRNNMFELAQQLVGIYKVNNMTRLISLANKNMI